MTFWLPCVPPLKSFRLLLLNLYCSKWVPRTHSIGTAGILLEMWSPQTSWIIIPFSQVLQAMCVCISVDKPWIASLLPVCPPSLFCTPSVDLQGSGSPLPHITLPPLSLWGPGILIIHLQVAECLGIQAPLSKAQHPRTRRLNCLGKKIPLSLL